MADYSLKLVRAMVEQGVTTIEYELQGCQKEAAVLAGNFHIPEELEDVDFPETYSDSNTIRMVYVTPEGSVASDGRQRSIIGRHDIVDAFKGKTSFYGPYFNEEGEFVVCYSAPVLRCGKAVGVLCIEKDGYYFSTLIRGIRFIDSGESYIINEEGTDIAVSDQRHIDWVNSQYNAGKILEKQEDKVTRSIFELEQKGLAGKSGIGTYEWEGSLCYLAYEPVPSANWVLLAGLRNEEILSIINTTMHDSFTKGPTLSICIAAFLLLTGGTAIWIVTSLKKSAEVNQRLEIAANYDPLTGLMNRYGYHNALDASSSIGEGSFACVYIDVNGLHEINNHLGHQAGDQMLKCVADMLLHIFSQNSAYRIGGDEFVVFCKGCTKQDTYHKAKLLRNNLKKQGYEISIGIAWADKDINIRAMVNTAETAMQQDKEQYYRENGKERQIRELDRELEQMLLEKQDADTFLSILAPEYKGVYFVNLDSDTIRHLYIPPYFESMLKETGYLFSKALYLYSQRYVMPGYQQQFDKFCGYSDLKALLNSNVNAEFIYQKNDGSWIKLQILKFKLYSEQNRETLWIFSTIEHST